MSSFTLEIRYANQPAETRTFSAAKVVFGRESGDVPLNDSQVSGRHAQVSFDGTTVTFKDLGSTNGSFDVAGQRLYMPRPMVIGQGIRMGGSMITLQAVGEGAAPEPAAPAAPSRAKTMFAAPGMMAPAPGGAPRLGAPPRPGGPAAPAPPRPAAPPVAVPAAPPAPYAPPAAAGGASGTLMQEPGQVPMAPGGGSATMMQEPGDLPSAGGSSGTLMQEPGQVPTALGGGSATMMQEPGQVPPAPPAPAGYGGSSATVAQEPGQVPPAPPDGYGGSSGTVVQEQGQAPAIPHAPAAAAPGSVEGQLNAAGQGIEQGFQQGVNALGNEFNMNSDNVSEGALKATVMQGVELVKRNPMEALMTLPAVFVVPAAVFLILGWIPFVQYLAYLLMAIVMFAGPPLGAAALSYYMLKMYVGEPVSGIDAWKAVLKNLVPTALSLLVAGMVAGAAANFFLVPGIALGCFIGPVFFVERKRFIDINMRCLEYFKQDVVRLIVLFFAGVAIVAVGGIVAGILSFVFGLLSLHLGSGLFGVVFAAAYGLGLTLVAAIYTCVYFELRVKMEGRSREEIIAEARVALAEYGAGTETAAPPAGYPAAAPGAQPHAQAPGHPPAAAPVQPQAGAAPGYPPAAPGMAPQAYPQAPQAHPQAPQAHPQAPAPAPGYPAPAPAVPPAQGQQGAGHIPVAPAPPPSATGYVPPGSGGQ